MAMYIPADPTFGSAFGGGLGQGLGQGIQQMMLQQQLQKLLPQLFGGGQQQQITPYAGAGGMITPEGGQLPGQGAMQGSWPGVGGAPQAQQGMNPQMLQALAQALSNPQMQGLGNVMLGRMMQPTASPYGKPPWYMSPEAQRTEPGQIAAGLKPRAAQSEQQLPAGYMEDLANAVSAIGRGADKVKTYQRMAKTYPQRQSEIRGILLARDPEQELFKIQF